MFGNWRGSMADPEVYKHFVDEETRQRWEQEAARRCTRQRREQAVFWLLGGVLAVVGLAVFLFLTR